MARVVLNEPALRRLLSSSEGPVAANLTQRAIRVESQAKINATGNNGGPRVRTGRLRSSITHRLVLTEQGIAAEIGTTVFYGRYLELGHPNTAHAYPIRSPGGKFTGKFGYVSNRPTRPYPFLRTALFAAR